MSLELKALNYAFANFKTDDFEIFFEKNGPIIKIGNFSFNIPLFIKYISFSKTVESKFKDFFQLFWVPDDVKISFQKVGRKVYLRLNGASTDTYSILLTRGPRYSINGQAISSTEFRAKVQDIGVYSKTCHDILTLREKGIKKSVIAKKLKISRKTVLLNIKKYGRHLNEAN